MTAMPIDLANVDWVYVGVLAVFAFLATVIGNILSLNHRGTAAVLAGLVFAALFVAWTYYPHGLPLPIAPAGKQATVVTPAPAAPAAPAAPVKPRNPVTDITPPAAR